MKVLFAVNNENISTQIVKKYQKEYKEIISYKNMYYFNAIVKELQRDKSYDRIVISEDLEPFANNNYDAIDKFLFEKLDNISDEATDMNGEDIPIILISTDRRTKSEPILVKLFGIGVYNALLGQDRSTVNVCKLLNKPRSKKEAKLYYKIESDEVNYKSENEENVSEAEIKNILNHYKRLGKDEDRYIESFNNIAAQYNDAQLRIITKFLPLNVKAVLEEKSPKYQSVMTFRDTTSTMSNANKQKEEGLKIGFLNNDNSKKLSKPIIVPTALKKVATKKVVGTKAKDKENVQFEKENQKESINNNIIEEIEPKEFQPNIEEETIQPVKRGRGRPKKVVQEQVSEPQVKRGRGRPKKVIQEQEVTLPGFDGIEQDDNYEDEITLPGFDDKEETILPGFEDEKEETILPGFEDIEQEESLEKRETILPGFEEDNDNITETHIAEEDNILPGFDIPQENLENEENNNYLDNSNSNYNTNRSYNFDNVSNLLSKDKKVVSFVGTTKNGTSFLVNNVAKCLSSMGIKTAILDLTENRNSYYIYTKNEEQLRSIAFESIKQLKKGIAKGLKVDKYLDVYTALPGEKLEIDNPDEIVSTLIKEYSVVLMDCDFRTQSDYFGISQELYVVQTMDILTIQPMTAFLRDLKAKDILKQEKIRIVINKALRVKGLTDKAIIGGLAFYNDPAMSFMTELFNKEMVKYCIIPFEDEVYVKYLEAVMDCEININGYSKNFNTKLKELANMVYPLVGNKYKPMGDYSSNNKFSVDMNNTLEQMKKKY